VATEKNGEIGEKARLIPVYGIRSKKEAERRATSALLAVLTVARDLSIELVSPLGASRARKAAVEAFTEVPFDLGGKKVRPDGLIRVTYGKTEWNALVEVKTGEDILKADQVNDYWDIARKHDFDHVITISNELVTVEGSHPTDGLRVQTRSPVQVSHLSWPSILTSAVRIMNHQGVEDPEQAWIIGELIRYMEHPASGVMTLDDMGPNWTSVRDAARTRTLSKHTEGIEEIVSRFEQMIRYASLRLSSEIGETVEPVLSRAHRNSASQRLADLVDSLVDRGVLDAKLRVPNTAGDLELTADLPTQQLVAAVEVSAPEDRGPRGRVSWLLNQLDTIESGSLVLETYAKNARTPITCTVEQADEDRHAAIGEDRVEAFRFRLVDRREMSTARRPTSRQEGFIGSALALIEEFYESVVQRITSWQAPAPKRKTPAGPGPTEEEIVDSIAEVPPLPVRRYADGLDKAEPESEL
jgi:hypothetical protein